MSLATGSNEPCDNLSSMTFGAIFRLFNGRGAIRVTKGGFDFDDVVPMRLNTRYLVT